MKKAFLALRIESQLQKHFFDRDLKLHVVSSVVSGEWIHCDSLTFKMKQNDTAGIGSGMLHYIQIFKLYIHFKSTSQIYLLVNESY